MMLWPVHLRGGYVISLINFCVLTFVYFSACFFFNLLSHRLLPIFLLTTVSESRKSFLERAITREAFTSRGE